MKKKVECYYQEIYFNRQNNQFLLLLLGFLFADNLKPRDQSLMYWNYYDAFWAC